MADNKKKDSQHPEDLHTDSLLNLKFAEAEADLSTHNGGLGPTTNEYVTDDENQEITKAEGPVDSQGQRRGEIDSSREGSNAGNHS